MTSSDSPAASGTGARRARALQAHLDWLDTFSGTALGVLATASGIYTYLGVSSLLDDTGAMSSFAALAYSVAVSVGIFVFWSYLLRLFPAVTTARARIGLMGAMALGSVAIIAMSSWLNAAALAGAGHRVAVLAEVGVLAHQRAHDGPHVGLALVFDRVDERVLLCLRLDSLAEFVVHCRGVTPSSGKLVRILLGSCGQVSEMTKTLTFAAA